MMGILGLVLLAAYIFTIVEIIKSGKAAGQKALWIVLVLLFPIIGLVAYHLVGRK